MYSPTLAEWTQSDPTEAEYVDGPDLYLLERANPINLVDPSGEAAIAPSGEFVIHSGVTLPLAASMRHFEGFAIEYVPDKTCPFKDSDIKLVQAISLENVVFGDRGGSPKGPHLDVQPNGDRTGSGVVNLYDWQNDATGAHTSTGGAIDPMKYAKWKLPGYYEGEEGYSYVPAALHFNSTAYTDLPGANAAANYSFPIEVIAVDKKALTILGGVAFTFYSIDGKAHVPGASWDAAGNQRIKAQPPGPLFKDAEAAWYKGEGRLH